MNYETCTEIEVRMADYFGYRQNIIVPNISWGLNLHECDLLILSKAGYATEVEIKVSKSDLIKDKEKRHMHSNNKIKNLYFAIPEKLNKDEIIKEIPKHSGIFVIGKEGRVKVLREAIAKQNPYKFTMEDQLQLTRLGCMRIWNLKSSLKNLKDLIKYKNIAK
jgi:hypothetical protein